MVFIHNIKRYVFRKNFVFIRRPVHDNGHDIEGLDPIIRLDRPPVYQYAAGIGGLLYAVARYVSGASHQKFVDAQEFLTLIGDKLEMLIHLTGISVFELYIFGIFILVFHGGAS